MVIAAVPVVCGLLALAFAVPAAGDPRQDSGTATHLSASARVQATLAALASREAALDNASARATVQLHVARRMLVVARRNLARRLRMLYEEQPAPARQVAARDHEHPARDVQLDCRARRGEIGRASCRERV